MKNITDIYNTGIITFICPAYPDTLWNVSCVANTEQHFTLPTGATCLQIDYALGKNANVYVRLGTASVRAVVPASNNTSDGTGSVANPSGFTISKSNTTISLISDVTTIVSISFWTSLSGVDTSGM